MMITDSTILNLDYSLNDVNSINLVDFFSEFRQRIIDAAKREEEMISSGEYEYTQVWVMSKEQYEVLPDNPTVYDFLKVGAMFQGYQWIKKN